jgi:hypothetical protein
MGTYNVSLAMITLHPYGWFTFADRRDDPKTRRSVNSIIDQINVVLESTPRIYEPSVTRFNLFPKSMTTEQAILRIHSYVISGIPGVVKSNVSRLSSVLDNSNSQGRHKGIHRGAQPCCFIGEVLMINAIGFRLCARRVGEQSLRL